MNHTQLRAFHAVAELGGFAAASRQVGLTQPALSVQVRALEQHFGIELFRRLQRRTELTKTGSGLHAITRQYFALETEAEDFLRAVGEFRSGEVMIAADGAYHVMPVLAAIRQLLPEIKVNVSLGNSDDVIRALTHYEAHLGFSSSTTFSDNIHIIDQSRHPIVLMLPRDHPWASRKQIKLESLKGVALVMRESGSSTRAILEQALEASGIEPEIAIEIGSQEAVREAVANGLGLGVVQQREFGNDDRLTTVRFAGRAPAADECLICLEDRLDSPMMRELIRIVSHLDNAALAEK